MRRDHHEHRETLLRHLLITLLQSDCICPTRLPTPRWSVDSEGFLLLDDKIYIPDTSDLQLRILQYKHDHLISSHFGQNRTMELV